jgi:hypothetical protein
MFRVSYLEWDLSRCQVRFRVRVKDRVRVRVRVRMSHLASPPSLHSR